MTAGTQARSVTPLLLILLLNLASNPGAIAAQTVSEAELSFPSQGFIIAGYGTAGWQVSGDNGPNNAFFASLSPLLLFQFNDRFLFEAELEFEIEEGVTETSLEYSQINWFLNDNIMVVAGKFLIPFGVFGERLHPTWINRSPSNPPIYGHGEGLLQPLLPIMSDFGGMVRGSWSYGGGRSLIASAYVTQGPSVEADDDHDAEAAALFANSTIGDEGDVTPLPEFQFGGSSSDINSNKMVGGRLGWVAAPAFEIDLSAFTGLFQEDARLVGTNIAGEYRHGALELRGEWTGMWYDVEVESDDDGAEPSEEDDHSVVTANTGGLYFQSAYRVGSWEPVVRWTKAFAATSDGLDDRGGFWQLSFGLDHWFSSSIALMAAYEINDSALGNVPDRFIVHWAFGF